MPREIRSSFNKVFQDYKNYPYGFSRSGDFSLKESTLLEQKGVWLAALADGKVAPESAEEEHLLRVIAGADSAESQLEKVWMKYQTRINRPHVGALSSRTVMAEVEEDDEPVELDDED